MEEFDVLIDGEPA